MEKRQILASLTCLPKLVNGKVAIISENNTYFLATVPKTVTIADNYNPLDYVLLNSDKWHNLVVYSKSYEKEAWMVNLQYRQLKKQRLYPPYKVGDKIHIHSRRGIYEVVEKGDDYIKITCKKWQYEENGIHTVHSNDFKCLAGGFYNHSF